MTFAIFQNLHRTARPLVLVNAWDAASARIFEDAGAPAIATTSAGVAWSLGYADGEMMPRSLLVDAVARICRVVSVPVSVDIERGFGRTPNEVCDTVRALADLGIVGINIEDGLDAEGRLGHTSVLAARLSAIRALDLELFVNARTDVYFASACAGPRLDEARRRAHVYRSAGADGIFVPGIVELGDMEALAKATTVPLNVYAGVPNMPSLDAMAAVGVRRVSLGCAPLQALLRDASALASAILGGKWPSTHSMLSNRTLDELMRVRSGRSVDGQEVSS